MNRHFIRILDQVNNPQAAAGGGPSNTSHQSEAEPAFHPLNHSPEPPTNDHHSRIGDVELDEHTPEEQARYHADQDYLNQQAAAIQQAHQDPPEEAAASTSTSAEPATAARQSVKGPGMILAHRSSCKTCRKRKVSTLRDEDERITKWQFPVETSAQRLPNTTEDGRDPKCFSLFGTAEWEGMRYQESFG